MTRLYLVFSLSLLFIHHLASAQPSDPSCHRRTGNNLTVIFPSQVKARGSAPREGNLVRAYTPDGTCVGELRWSHRKGQALTVWGDDFVTRQKDGAAEGDVLRFQLVAHGSREPVSLTLNSSNHAARYTSNGIILVDEIMTSDDEQAETYAIGEAGTVPVIVRNRRHSQQVKLKRRYRRPVVLLQISSTEGGDPAEVYLSRTGSDEFEFFIERAEFWDKRHSGKLVSYLVVEQGTHRLADGTLIEAGLTQATERGSRVSFATHFPSTPILFTEAIVQGQYATPIARLTDVSKSSFRVFLQGQIPFEQLRHYQPAEPVGWVAIAPARHQGTDVPYRAGLISGLDQQWTDVSFGRTFSTTAAFLADVQTARGRGRAYVHANWLSQRGVRLRLHKQQGSDGRPTNHTESVGYLAIEPGILEATRASAPLYASADAEAETVSESPSVRNAATVETATIEELPRETALLGNYPNPFSGRTSIQYELAHESDVALTVFDMLGREVARLVEGRQGPGRYSAPFDASNLPSGLYFCRLDAGGTVYTSSMVAVK